MVAEEGGDDGDVGIPRYDGVVGGEVISPEEALAAQQDRCREVHIERDEEGHLQQHRQAATHGAGSSRAVEVHRLRLALHHGLLLLAGVLGIDGLDLWA